MSTILSGRRDRRAPIVAGPAWVDPYAVPSTRRCVVVDLGADRALFSISVAAEVTGVSPQMLRVYEQKGLLVPHRTEGGTRRYSGHELDRIGEITTLLAAGLNLAGVEHVFRLRAENLRLQDEVDRLHRRHASAETTEAGGPHSGG